MSQQKFKMLPIGDKIKIIEEVDRGFRRVDIAKKYNVSASTVTNIWKNKNDIRTLFDGNKKKRVLKFATIDDQMIEWFRAMREKNIPVSGAIMKEQAMAFARESNQLNFYASSGWLEKFKKRYVY